MRLAALTCCFMKYKNAWKCQRCPESNNEQGCPAWIELIETHMETGQERINRNCLFQMMPHLMVELIKASNRPAAEMSAMRGEVINKVQQLTTVVSQKMLEDVV